MKRNHSTAFIIIIVFLLGCIVLVALSLVGVKSQMEAVNHVERNGGYVNFHVYGPRWLANIFGQYYPFKSVSAVGFGSRTTDSDLTCMRFLNETRMLYLNGTNVKGAGLTNLTQCRNLRVVELTGSDVTDSGIRTLVVACPRLTRLAVGKTVISDTGVCYLKNLRSLHELFLNDTKITDVALECISKLPLKTLDLTDTQVTSNGVAYIKKHIRGVEVLE